MPHSECATASFAAKARRITDSRVSWAPFGSLKYVRQTHSPQPTHIRKKNHMRGPSGAGREVGSSPVGKARETTAA